MEHWDAAGRWIGSAIDLMRFVNGIEGRNGVPAILQPATVALMTARPTGIWPATGCYYAMFWVVCPAGQGSMWFHDGGPEGAYAYLERRADGTAFAILINKGQAISLDLGAILDRVTNWPSHDLFQPNP